MGGQQRQGDEHLRLAAKQAVATAVDLIAFCRRLGVLFGLNVESVSIRKVEIDASCGSPPGWSRVAPLTCPDKSV